MNIKIDSSNLIPIIVGISGHRDIDIEIIYPLKQKLKEILSSLQNSYPNSPIKLFTPLAEGADQIAAQAALELNIDLVVPLPMPLKEYKKDFPDNKSLAEFEELLSRSAHSFDLSQVYYSNEEFDWDKKEIRESAYKKVGQYIAKQSQILLALWDGKENESIGGTASIINYKLNGIEYDNNSYDNSLGQVEGGLVYHLFTPRKGDKASNDTAALKIYCPPFWKEVSQANVFYHNIFKSINTFNKDIIHFQKDLIKAKPLLNQNQDELFNHLDTTGKSLLNHFNTADYMAQRFKIYRTRALRFLLSFVVIAFTFFHVYLSLYENIILLSLYPILLAIGALIYWRAKRRGYETKYEDYRSLSEALRIQIYWNLNGNKENVSDYLLQKHKGELEWIKYAIRNWTLDVAIKSTLNNEEKSKDRKIKCNLLLNFWIENQKDWYFAQGIVNEKKDNKIKRTANILFSVGLLLAIFLIMIDLYKEHLFQKELLAYVRHSVVLFIGLCLTCSGALLGYKEKMVFSEQAKQYDRMYHIFDFITIKIKNIIASGNYSGLENLCFKLGKESLTENGDWLLLHRSRPLEMPKS